jgi:hypothetical protein
MFTAAKRLMRLLSVLIIIFIGGINVLSAEATKPNNDKRQQTIKKLKEIIVERIDWEYIDAAVALKDLQKISEKHGINIILKLTPQEKKKQFLVDLVLVKSSLMDAIIFFCKTAELKYHISENEVVISLVPNPVEASEYQQEKAKRDALIIKKKFQSIRIPNVKFINADIYTVVRDLSWLSAVNDSDKFGINIAVGYEAETVPEFSRITINLNNVSIGEVLRSLCRDNGLKYKIEGDYVLLFYDPTNKIHVNKTPADNAILKKLKKTVERLELKDTKISEAVKIISKKYGINIILRHDEEGDEPVVGLLLKNRNLYQVIYFLCKASDYYFKIEDNAVIISSNPSFQKYNGSF